MRINILFLLFVALFNAKVKAQEISELINSLSKRKLEFELRKKMQPSYSVKTDTGYIIIPYTVHITSEKMDSTFNKFNRRELTKALYEALFEKDKDWNANLLLYALTKRDALLLIGVYNRKKWIKKTKQMDVKIWKKYLN